MTTENESLIAIERACEKLVIAFAACVDGQDYEGLTQLFTTDAGFARPTDPGTVIRGADNIVNAYRSRPRTRITQHLCSNVQITVHSSERATGTCRVLLFMADATGPDMPGKGRQAQASQLVGAFDDEFVRTPQGWRFAERRGRLLMHT
ncbi:MAG TPA: nuclear transport factor 2 family protein [Steroidobacteraceae bacterium]|nr:nuclear transport factor 2 family protein [Steroidobacteraceae bacterium]